MTMNQTIFVNRMKAEQKKENNRRALVTMVRTFASLLIPLTAALFVSLVATFVVHANGGAGYFYNVWFLFCKMFFPCTPFMMYFIMK